MLGLCVFNTHSVRAAAPAARPVRPMLWPAVVGALWHCVCGMYYQGGSSRIHDQLIGIVCKTGCSPSCPTDIIGLVIMVMPQVASPSCAPEKGQKVDDRMKGTGRPRQLYLFVVRKVDPESPLNWFLVFFCPIVFTHYFSSPQLACPRSGFRPASLSLRSVVTLACLRVILGRLE